MKKIMMIGLFLLALAFVIPESLAVNATSTDRYYVNYAFYRGNFTYCYSRYPCFPNGTACNPYVEPECWACPLEGKTYGGQAISPAPACLEYIQIDNVEQASFNLLVKLIPFPQDECFSNNTNCVKTGWNTKARLRTENNSVIADMSTCWNWWNSSDTDVQDEQANYCPIVSVYIPSSRRNQRIYLDWADEAGADSDYIAIVLGYSTSIINLEERVSPTLKGMGTAILELVTINVNIWKILYYLFVIISLIVGIIALVGFLPLSIKWIIKKVTS